MLSTNAGSDVKINDSNRIQRFMILQVHKREIDREATRQLIKKEKITRHTTILIYFSFKRDYRCIPDSLLIDL